MIIAIAGMSGSGKNTVGELVAKMLKLRAVEYTFKDYARDMGIDLMEFQKMAREDETIDRGFDKRVVADAKKGKCVVTTWLGPWTVKKADLRVWLDAAEETRAKRIAKREKMSARAALAHLKTRDSDNIARYKKLYGVDITDKGIFDLIIRTDHILPQDIADAIVLTAKSKANFRKNSPASKSANPNQTRKSKSRKRCV
ncbi:MAG: (d)CMP kinase [Acidobacteriota bacterium]